MDTWRIDGGLTLSFAERRIYYGTLYKDLINSISGIVLIGKFSCDFLKFIFKACLTIQCFIYYYINEQLDLNQLLIEQYSVEIFASVQNAQLQTFAFIAIIDLYGDGNFHRFDQRGHRRLRKIYYRPTI